MSAVAFENSVCCKRLWLLAVVVNDPHQSQNTSAKIMSLEAWWYNCAEQVEKQQIIASV